MDLDTKLTLIVFFILFLILAWGQYLLKEEARKKRNLGLTCVKCGFLGMPIDETGNRYRCEKCGKQFVSDKHHY